MTDRGLAFIQYDGSSQHTKTPRTQPPKTYKTQVVLVENSDQAVIPTKTSEIMPGKAETTSTLEFGATICTPVDEIYVTYTLTHLLRGVDEEDPSQGVQRTLSDQCFMALATTYFGTQHQEKSVFEHGLQRYGKALKDVNMALGDPGRVIGYDLLESVVVMALFEVSSLPFLGALFASHVDMRRSFSFLIRKLVG